MRSFVGWSLICPLHPPATKIMKVQVLHLLRCFTHTPSSSGFSLRLRLFKAPTNEMKVKMKEWKWDDKLLHQQETRRGTQKRKGKGETPTPTHLAQSWQTLKGQGKRKSRRTTGQTLTRKGEAVGSAWHNLYKARAKPTSAREGPKPDLQREHAWDRGPMGN